ncbi:hypothetical protein Ccrd_014946 [Cynara cardunculus var. scolymus]|uniref:Uncharacterized protein n=1 Tax=Cynara cardunculus var. scolymus TaxID=59895 RepID=A0A103YCS1_CYNCS|nr:hypothetical protein Ccrd_014946 [Cynara cardunculus var. scolymus]
MGCLDCFGGGQEQFAQSAAGRAARAQMQAAAKQASNTNKGEPTLKLRFEPLHGPAALASEDLDPFYCCKTDHEIIYFVGAVADGMTISFRNRNIHA